MYHISKLSSGYGLNSCALCWDDLYSSKYLTTIIYIDATFGFLALLWGSATIGLKIVQGGTKTMGITVRILVAPGGSHLPWRIPLPKIKRKQWYSIGVTGLYYTLQYVSGQLGYKLAITYSIGRIRHTWWTRDGSGKDYGRVLWRWRTHRIAGPRVGPMGNQCSYWNLPKSWPDVQR